MIISRAVVIAATIGWGHAVALLVTMASGGGQIGPAPGPAPYSRTFDGPPGQAGPTLDVVIGGGGVQAGPALQVPWMCGQTEYCTQGHNGGSHTGTSSWAWDFAQQDGEEIWAASAGTVTHLKMDSNSGGCDQAFSAQANYITIDHGDGTSIVYLHMQGGSSPLQVGETVEVGDLVARVGETGWACGAHLHMQVMETCGGYYCQSLQASFEDYGDPVPDTTYAGTNCPTCTAVLDGGQTVIDDEDAGCLQRVTTAWSSSYQGHGDHHFYTLATDAPAADSSATWVFSVNVPGDYRVEVFVPDADADTQNATYLVHHEAGTAEVPLDQSTAKGWQELGTFAFVGAAGEGIELGDDTGENLDALGRRIAFDAVRLTFVPDAADDAGSGDATGAAEDSGDDLDDAGGTATGASTEGDSADGTGAEGDGPGAASADDGGGLDGTAGGLPPGFGAGADDDAGCACEASGPPARAGFTIATVLLFGLGQLRRRPRRT